MSSVRMCDRCGALFSELQDGWQVFQATAVRRDKETGKTVNVSVAMDACPKCALGTGADYAPPPPRIDAGAFPAAQIGAPPALTPRDRNGLALDTARQEVDKAAATVAAHNAGDLDLG